MRRLFAWFRSHPLTTIFLVLIGFAVGTHLFANWRAEVRWQRYCAAARARGVKLTLAEFAPPEIPDAENFAQIPMLRAIFTGGVQSPLELPRAGSSQPAFGNAVKGERLDWKAWQKFFKDAGYIADTTDDAPRDVLRALEHYAPQFKEWSEWRSRPRCRFNLDTRDVMAMPLPHLSTFVDAAKLFSLRLRAHLALGDSATAYVDFTEGIQAYHKLSEEPVLISGLVRISALTTILAAVGDGLAQRAWDESELKGIAQDLSSIRVCADYLEAFSSERGFGNQFGDELIAMSPRQRAQILTAVSAARAWSNGGNYPPSWAYLVFPKRLYRDNQLRCNQHIDEICARVTEDQFQPSTGTPTSLENLTGLDVFYYCIFSPSNGVFAEIGSRYAHLRTQLDETRLAIAVERCRMARGEYPERLAELVPDFIAALPVDTYSSQSLIYRRKDGGTFFLYGVGKDRTDEDGKIDPKKSEHKQPDDVWLFAPPPSK